MIGDVEQDIEEHERTADAVRHAPASNAVDDRLDRIPTRLAPGYESKRRPDDDPGPFVWHRAPEKGQNDPQEHKQRGRHDARISQSTQARWRAHECEAETDPQNSEGDNQNDRRRPRERRRVEQLMEEAQEKNG